jgi:hypothetical protein
LDCAVGLAERGDARPADFVRARARQDHGRVDARVVELAADDALEVQVVLLGAIEVEGVEGQRRARRRARTPWRRGLEELRDGVGVGLDARRPGRDARAMRLASTKCSLSSRKSLRNLVTRSQTRGNRREGEREVARFL